MCRPLRPTTRQEGHAMKRKLGVVIGLAAAVAVALALSGVFSDEQRESPVVPSAEAATTGDQEPLARLLDGFSTGDTAAYVNELEQRVDASPYDADVLTLLGLAYQQLARETGDPSYYTRSEQTLLEALPSGPHEALVTVGLASLAGARHEFDEQRELAEKALELDGQNASAYGALGDALLNLGRHEEAFAAYDRMAELAPGVASYARIAHARELIGRPNAAIDAIKAALDIGTSVPEYEAWARVELGNMHFESGKLTRARAAFEKALSVIPEYVHAEAGLAQIDAARGNFDSAIDRLGRVVERLPVPEYAELRGDVLTAAGRIREAEAAYELVEARTKLLAANGVRTELDSAHFALDHDRDVGDALAHARVAYQRAPSLEAEDVLAWALYKNGRCEEAERHSLNAMRLGTGDPLVLFHHGMIQRCLGNEEAAQESFAEALAANPHFSLRYAPIAEALIR